MTKLQLALDDISIEHAVELLEKVEGYIDIVEVGTPFLMQYGLQTVREIKSKFFKLEVLCDAKIMDAGGYEAEIVYEAGADYVTVLGVTDDLTIKECIVKAREYNKKVMVDMICVPDLKLRLQTLESLNVDAIAIHTGVDQQAIGRTPLDDLKEISEYVKETPIAVAGGINPKTINAYMHYQPEIVIVGGGIVNAEDPATAAKEISRSIKGE
ncbi:3-hexulose-6-phosphate synthase [Oceanobacillus jeddahense]|uniref:3-hexulose-6-phosphate synthase n=1 Tax=Oceanobacillus jeddahense TaxID=1462527 RepID=UPI000595D38B|nr:3-hexulose-6-phosphate synthase [Oceanobacillus jeddahense]